MRKLLLLTFALVAVGAAFAGGNGEKESNDGTETGGLAGQKRILINAPQLIEFTEGNTSGLADYVQGILSDNFVKYSGMTVVIAGEVPDYYLVTKIYQRSPSKFATIMTLAEGEGEGEGVKAPWESVQFSISISDLVYGKALNLATKDILTGLKVKLSGKANKELSEKVDSEYAEGKFISFRPNTSWMSDEQIANILDDLDPGRRPEPKIPSFVLPEFSPSEFVIPAFTPLKVPAFKPPEFKPPEIRTSRKSTTGSTIRGELDRYRADQEANRAAVEEWQQDLLRQWDAILVQRDAILAQREVVLGQRQSVLDQWQNFLGEVDRQRQRLRAEEQRLFQVQAELEAELGEGEAYYRTAPPFRILYDPNVELLNVNPENETANMRFHLAVEPTSLKVLEDRIDNLVKLNKSFEGVGKAFLDVNNAMAARHAQFQAEMDKVEAAMNAVKAALGKVGESQKAVIVALAGANEEGQKLGQNYKVAPVSIPAFIPMPNISIGWAVPPGANEYGTTELKTSWTVDYPRSFDLTVSLLLVTGGGDNKVIERQLLSLTSDIYQNDPFKPEADSVRGFFNNVSIAGAAEDDNYIIWVEAVNGIAAETAAMTGYIEIIPDGARTAAVGKRVAKRGAGRQAAKDAQMSWENYFSDPDRFTSLGAAIGTAFATPALLASAKLTFSPFRHFFFEAGSDFGLVHGEKDVKGVEYLSIAPYLHLNYFVGGDYVLFYIGGGGGASFSQYTYPSASHVEPVTVNTPAFDVNTGMLILPGHSIIDIRYTIKTNFKGNDHRLTLGYGYRFGNLTNRRYRR
ncbi:MAG: hypothetical protein LBF83_02350 [Spirochaetaceae bacterium]|jgi:hypothetical protein|nr:hypothetical protein [Spirochaetaceae bacterium]